MATRIEVREETHPDVVRHVHPRHVQVVKVSLSDDGTLAAARGCLLHLLRRCINKLVGLKVRACWGAFRPCRKPLGGSGALLFLWQAAGGLEGSVCVRAMAAGGRKQDSCGIYAKANSNQRDAHVPPKRVFKSRTS